MGLEDLGYEGHFQTRFAELGGSFVPARIAVAHGESYVAWAARGPCKAILGVRRADAWQTATERPQVGDWVAGTYSESAGSLLIEHLLERRTCLVRMASGKRLEAQVIAANVDVVGIVGAFGAGDAEDDVRLIGGPRLQRYLTAVERSGASAVLVLNKSDLCKHPQAVIDALAGQFPGVPVVVTSAAGGSGLETLAPWLGRGITLGFVGVSGVGKSTLVNALLGRTAQQTNDIRASDARGRHTTTHRELFRMDDGALLIDTPGMREMALGEDEAVSGFDDVIALMAGCRFGDCRHATEPDCAIRQNLGDGGLSPERWEAFTSRQQPFQRPPPRSRRRGGR